MAVTQAMLPAHPDGAAAPDRAGSRGLVAVGPVADSWTRPDAVVVDPPPRGEHLPVWSGPVVDDLGTGAPVAADAAACWVLGVHGGAGASTVAALLEPAAEAFRGWPDPVFGGPADLVLVARLSALGLHRLRAAARQWAAGCVPAGLRLRAAVLVAAAPGRIPRPLLEELSRVTHVVPAVHRLRWRPDLVTAVAAPGGPIPPELSGLVADRAPGRVPTGPGPGRVGRRSRARPTRG